MSNSNTISLISSTDPTFEQSIQDAQEFTSVIETNSDATTQQAFNETSTSAADATDEVQSNYDVTRSSAADSAGLIQDSGGSWKLPANNPIDKGWTEPPSAANFENPPRYPFNNVTLSESGHFFELDDTPGRERVRLQHRTGSFIEWHPNADEVHKIMGDGYEIVAKNKNVLIKGVCNITINGDSVVHVKGDKYEKIDGNFYQLVNGNYEMVVKKELRVDTDGDLDVSVGTLTGGKINIDVGSPLNGEVHIDADVQVNGGVSADNLHATMRCDAMLGMSAGPYGFVTVLGGVSAGIPVATPGFVQAVGMVTAPLGQFVWMHDTVNVPIFDLHTHIAMGTPTSPPLTPMI